VGALCDRIPKNPSTMRGKFTIDGNLVTAIVKKSAVISVPPTSTNQYRRKNKENQQQEKTTTFHLELEIANSKRPHRVLRWSHYAAFSTQKSLKNVENEDDIEVTNTTFDLNPNRYPSLYFSRVKSYNSNVRSIL